MAWIFATVLLLVTLAIAFQVSVLRKARKMEGEQAPLLEGEAEDSEGGSRLLYFFSPRCAPCRRMSPSIESLQEEFPKRVVSMDITEHTGPVEAYRIRATPTTILVKSGKIEKVMLGFQSAARLRAMLQ